MVRFQVQSDHANENHLTKLSAIEQALERLVDQKNYLAGAAAGLRHWLPASQMDGKAALMKRPGLAGRRRNTDSG